MNIRQEAVAAGAPAHQHLGAARAPAQQDQAGSILRPDRTWPDGTPGHSHASWRRPWRMKWNGTRSEEHTSELQSLMRISYAVFCLKKKKDKQASINITP